MFKLLTKKQKHKLMEHVRYNSSNTLNKIPSLMSVLIDEDPKYIKYVQGPAASVEMFERVLNHPDFYIEILYDAVRYSKGIQNNYEIMKKLCSMDGKLIKYCPGEIFTFELFEIALKNLKDNESYYNMESYVANINLNKTNTKELEKLIAYNGRFLKRLDEKSITRKLIKLALENDNPDLRPKIEDLTNIRDSKKLMFHLCEIDGLNFIYGYEEALTSELLKYALNHPDIEKRLSFERIPEDFEFNLKYHEIKDLIKEDSRWLKFIDITSLNEFDLVSILKRSNIAPNGEVINHFKRNKYVLNNIINEVKKGKYTSKELREMLSIEMTPRFIETDFFKEVSKRICEIEDIDYDFFRKQAIKLVAMNREAFLTLNFQLLNKRFYKLYEDDSYEKLFSLSIYPIIQEDILKIGNPIKNGEVDIELGDKRIELLSRMLKSSLKYKNGEKVSDWPVYYNKLIKAYSKYPGRFDWLLNEEIDDNLLQTFTNHILGDHRYEITNIEELKNYEEVRNKFIEKQEELYILDSVKEALLEKVFGISLNSAKELIPYRIGVLMSPELFHPDIVEFIKTIDIILKESNVSILKKTISTFKRKDKLDEKEIINLRSMMKKTYLQEYNKAIYQPKEHSAILRGIKVYKAAGELGNEKFNLCIHSLGAYFGSISYRNLFANYKKTWNRPEITNHGICSSFVGNSNLGMAPTRSAILGFTNFEDGALLLSGPEDIYSSNESFDTMGDEDRKSTYLMPKDMIDYTRYAHNEMVFERKVGTTKRQPSYIVLVCDDYEKAVRQFNIQEKIGRYTLIGKIAFMNADKEADKVYNALKAAKDFGIPIVVVETDKIAKHEYEQIQSNLNEFIEKDSFKNEEIKDYFYNILTLFANNHSGCRKNGSKIELNYFNEEQAQILISKIQTKIGQTINKDPYQAIMMLKELKKVMELENEKTPMSGTLKRPTYSTHAIIKYCDKLEERIIEDINKTSDIGKAFASIESNNYLMEYQNHCIDLQEKQLNIDAVVNNLNHNTYKNMMLKIKQIEVDTLYEERKNGAHSTRHIQDVIFFATAIGEDLLNEKDLDLLLTAALYHDAGRMSDGHEQHAYASSILANNNLKDRYSEEDLKIIRAAIEYHEVVETKDENGNVDFINLTNICKNLDMDITDEKLMDRTRTIATCLKDADALDRTRFISKTKSFTNPNLLHHSKSKELIKIGMQINEYYAVMDIEKTLEKRPNLKPFIEKHLIDKKNPKLTMRAVRTSEFKIKHTENKSKKISV